MSTSNEKKIEYYDRVLNIEEKSPEILAMLSEVFVNDNEKHAMKLAEQALKESGKECDYAFYVLAKLDLKNGNLHGARVKLKQAISICANRVCYYRLLSKVYEESQLFDEAMKYQEKCIELNPYNVESYATIGYLNLIG